MDTITRRSRFAALSTVALAALTLTACDSADEALDAGEDNEPESNVTVGAEEDEETDEATEDSAEDSTDEADDETTVDSTEDSTEDSTDESAEEDADAVENHPVYGGLAAVEAEYADGVVFEIDDNDSTYEWHVYSEGSVYEIEVDKQTLEIVDTEDDGAPDGDEQSEIDAVEFGLEEALRSVEDRAGDPTGAFIDEVELDTEDGVIVWSIELADGTEIDIDVTTGDIVREEAD